MEQRDSGCHRSFFQATPAWRTAQAGHKWFLTPFSSLELFRSRESSTGDGEESAGDAQQSVHEGQIGIRSRHVIEYGCTKEVRSLMKGQVYWRGLSVRPDI